MTETQRPTQADFALAIGWAKAELRQAAEDPETVGHDDYTTSLVLLALAAENKALEERVHSLKGAMMGALAHLDNTQGARDWLLDKLKADNAKAAGEPPELTWALAQGDALAEWCNRAGAALTNLMSAYERRIRSDCSTEQLESKPWECREYVAAREALARKPTPAVTIEAKAAGGPERNASLPVFACVACGLESPKRGHAAECPGKPAVEAAVEPIQCAYELDSGFLCASEAEPGRSFCADHRSKLNPPTDDRASRRRAYVRKHAARFLRAYIRAGCSADLSRANAIEQAGLIFDETEQSDD